MSSAAREAQGSCGCSGSHRGDTDFCLGTGAGLQHPLRRERQQLRSLCDSGKAAGNSRAAPQHATGAPASSNAREAEGADPCGPASPGCSLPAPSHSFSSALQRRRYSPKFPVCSVLVGHWHLPADTGQPSPFRFVPPTHTVRLDLVPCTQKCVPRTSSTDK